MNHERTGIQAEVEALRAAVDRWRLLVECAPDFIVLVDADGRMLYVNRTVPGIRVEEAVGRTVYDYTGREHQAVVRESLARVFEHGETVDFEATGPGPDGTRAWYHSRVGPVVRDGRIIAATLIASDVTDRRRAREALRRSTDRLVELMETIPHYLWTKEFDGGGHLTYRYYTPVVERITGRPADFFMESPDRWISTVHEEDRPRVLATAGRLLARASDHEEAQYRILLPDGGVRWVRDAAIAEPMKGGGVRLSGVVSEMPALDPAIRRCDELLAGDLPESSKAAIREIRRAITGNGLSA